VAVEADFLVVMSSRLPADQKEPTPHYLNERLAGSAITQIHQLRINSKEVFQKGFFVLVSLVWFFLNKAMGVWFFLNKAMGSYSSFQMPHVQVVTQGNPEARLIGCVESIWKATYPQRSTLFLKLTCFKMGNIYSYFKMHILHNEHRKVLCNASVSPSIDHHYLPCFSQILTDEYLDITLYRKVLLASMSNMIAFQPTVCPSRRPLSSLVFKKAPLAKESLTTKMITHKS
jgi:hypothetical protein